MTGQPLFFGPLLYFRTVPALEGLTSAQLAAIAQHAEEDFFPAGAPLLQPGRPAEAFFVIVQGKVSIRSPRGWEETRGQGEAVGFLHLLGRSEEEMEVRALWDTVALRVDWDAHLDVCERYFPILEAHIGYLAQGCLKETDRIRGGGAHPPEPFRLSRPDEEKEEQKEQEEVSPIRIPPAPLDLVQRLQVLHRSPAFPSSNMDALAELARHLEEVRLVPGEKLWRAGDPSDSFLLIASGAVTLEDPRGPWRQEVGPGEVAGWFEALGRLAFQDSLRATASTVALRVAVEPLMDILEDHFTMAVDFTAELARKLMELQETGPHPPPEDELL